MQEIEGVIFLTMFFLFKFHPNIIIYCFTLSDKNVCFAGLVGNTGRTWCRTPAVYSLHHALTTLVQKTTCEGCLLVFVVLARLFVTQ